MPNNPQTTDRWEYKSISWDDVPEGKKLEDVWASLGAEGWEMFSVIKGLLIESRWYFKRRLP